MKGKTFALEFYGGIVTLGTFFPGIFDSIWCAPENSMCSLGILIITVDNRETDNGSLLVESEKKKKTHRKEATHSGNKVRLFN